jgi:hypothetical protein
MQKTSVVTRFTIFALLLTFLGIGQGGRFIGESGAVRAAKAAQTQGSLRALCRRHI